MATAEAETLVGPAQTPVRTGALSDEGLMAAKPLEVAFREAWRQTLEKVSMMRFVRFPDLEAEGLLPPTGRAISKAIAITNCMLTYGSFPPPMRVLPNGEGGIVFERWDEKGNSERMEFSAAGQAELSAFQGSKLVARNSMT